MQWEYIYILAHNDEVDQIQGRPVNRIANPLPETLEKFGKQGWEMVSATAGGEEAAWWRMIFKRPRND
jgi:hypothetical protein